MRLISPRSICRSALTFGMRLRANPGVAFLEAAARPLLVQVRTVLSTVLFLDLDHPAAPLSATSASVIARRPRAPFAHNAIDHCKEGMSATLRSDHLIVSRRRTIKMFQKCRAGKTRLTN